MGQDEAVKRDEPGPDEMLRWRDGAPEKAVRRDTEDGDTEGHKREAGGPDEGIRLPATPEGGEAPGPDGTRFSDRNLKTGIVPVEW